MALDKLKKFLGTDETIEAVGEDEKSKSRQACRAN